MSFRVGQQPGLSLAEEHIGFHLIANGNINDHSKFFGIEWEYLNDGAWPFGDESKKELFLAALHQHVSNNAHHPEHWNGIENMPDVYVCEMVCDWKARSSEQGTDLMEWIKDSATERFKFNNKSRVYKTIKSYVGILLEKKFT